MLFLLKRLHVHDIKIIFTHQQYVITDVLCFMLSFTLFLIGNAAIAKKYNTSENHNHSQNLEFINKLVGN